MTKGQAIMLAIGLGLAAGGGLVALRPVRSERAIYARRIGATMMLALGLTLCLFAVGIARQ